MERQARIDRFLLDLHALGMMRLRGNAEGLAVLQKRLWRIRRRANAQRHEVVWNRWAELLDAADLDAIEASICAEDDAGRALRTNSPIHALFEQREMAALIDETAPEERRAFLEVLAAPSLFGALGKPER